MGQLALRNIYVLVADHNIACEDLLIGILVLRQLRIDSRTLLELDVQSSIVPTAAMWEILKNRTRLYWSGSLMMARVKNVKERGHTDGQEYGQKSSKSMRDRPRVEFYETPVEVDNFPDPYLLEKLMQFNTKKFVQLWK